MADDQRVIRFTEYCRSPADVVYDALADLRTHLEWAGTGEESAESAALPGVRPPASKPSVAVFAAQC